MGDSNPFYPDDHAEPDYNLHSVDLEADDAALDDFDARAHKAMGLREVQ